MYTNFLITYLAIFLLVTPLTFVYAITQVFNILVLSYYLVFTNFACQSLPLFCSCFFFLQCSNYLSLCSFDSLAFTI